MSERGKGGEEMIKRKRGKAEYQREEWKVDNWIFEREKEIERKIKAELKKEESWRSESERGREDKTKRKGGKLNIRKREKNILKKDEKEESWISEIDIERKEQTIWTIEEK